jgi:hypothetical protein
VLLLFATFLLGATPVAAQDWSQVCDDGEPHDPNDQSGQRTLTTSRNTPVLEITDGGALTWLDESRGTIDAAGVTRIRVSASDGAVVRAELVVPGSPGRGDSLGCGYVRDGSTIELRRPTDMPADAGRLLRISVFRPLRMGDEQSRVEAARRTRVAALETESLRRWYAAATVARIREAHVSDELPTWLDNEIRDRCASAEPFAAAVCTSLRELRSAPDLPVAVAAVQPPPAHPELADACHDVARLRSLRDDFATRLVTTHEIPWTTHPVALVAYGDPRVDFSPAPDARLGGLVAVDVPLGASLTFRRRVGDRVAGSFAVALGRFARLASRVASLAESPDPCVDYPPSRADDGIPPAALVGTRAYLIREFDRERELAVDVCEGASCTDATTRTTLHVTPRRSVEFAVMLEGGFNVLSGRVSGANAPSWAYEQPRYRAVGGTLGPEQLYVLENELRPGRLVTMSALLGVSFPLGDLRAMTAIGVVLFDGEGRRSFMEGSVRFGIEVAPYVYLTIGSSLTRLPLDVDPGQPQAVAVPRPTAGTVPPGPTLDPADAWVWNGGLGLAIDLALFGTAAEDVVKALEGS